MKDIKSLYNEALMNKSNKIIDAYSESLNYIIENNPYEYISNLEYIITSNIGVSTLESFINKYGLSIPVFENIMTILEKTIEKCEKRNLDSSVFKEAHNKLIDHYESNKECFHMFEFYDIENKQDYIKKYYSFNERAIQYRKLAPVMISLFNEAAIPDLLITAKNTKGLTHKKFIDYMIEKLSENKILCEWIYTVENNWKSFDDEYINHIYEYTLSKSVNDIKIKSYNMYRESVIMGENKLYEMTEEEKINITDLIAFKEYRFISNDNSGIKLDDIYEMYSLLPESEFKESDADIVQMLPGSYKESETTSNKTSGTSPDYIKKNHNMAKWGEEEDGKGSEHNMDNDNDLDDYKRPSVRTYDKVEDDSESDDSEENKPPNPSQSNSSNVNNYYYYSYQNSFNKHHKNIDDHSTHNTTNISNSYNKSNDLKKESLDDLFNLNILDEEYYNEGIKDVFKKISSKISGMFKKLTLANLQNLSYEDKIIPTNTIPGTMLPKSLLMKESYDDISEDDNIESFNESAVENYLSKNDIKNIINKLRKKFNAEIYFSNSEILSVTGGALAIETTIETIESLIKGKKIYKLPIKALGDEGEFKRVILVSPKVLSKSMKSNNPRILELILSHEYGHILTFDQITVDDWFEYNIKRKLNSQIMVSLYPNNYNDLIPEYQYYIYHQLKPEKIANEAMNIDPKEVIKAAYGRDIKGPESLSKININEFINFKTSALYKKVYSDSMKGIKVNPKDRIASLEEVKSILKRVINDKSKLNDFILLYDELINEYKTESINEAVGDADDNKPDSDHPIKDTLMDIDREMTKHGQAAKKKIQDIQNVGKAAIKPFKRMNSWINNMINQWKDNDENKIKEKMADPRQRKNLYNGIKQAILGGSLLKAGLLLNPIFLFLALTKSINNKNNEFRLRNEMIGEIKAELEIIEEKIKDADRKGDNKAKYQLMRFRNEMKKKLLRVGGGKQWSKII